MPKLVVKVTGFPHTPFSDCEAAVCSRAPLQDGIRLKEKQRLETALAIKQVNKLIAWFKLSGTELDTKAPHDATYPRSVLRAERTFGSVVLAA